MDDSHDHDGAPSDNSTGSGALPFGDGKAPDALRTIGEVAKLFGLRAHVLRYWEEQFPTLRPIKRSGNRRYYRPEDVALIGEIDRLVHREGYTLRGAAKMLADKAPPEVAGRPVAEGERELAIAPATAGRESTDPDFLRKLALIRSDLANALERA